LLKKRPIKQAWRAKTGRNGETQSLQRRIRPTFSTRFRVFILKITGTKQSASQGTQVELS